MKLTKKQFWESLHDTYIKSDILDFKTTRKGRMRRIVDNARLRRGAQVGQGYTKFAIHNLLRAHLPIRADWSVIEVGCVPGNNLIDLHNMFGYKPYGIEYSHSGVLLTRKTFCKYGLDTDNVIEADFFDQGFHNRFREKFDIVFSAGFIEHFDPPNEVLNLQKNLLKPGGYLICTIPDLLGISYPSLWLCARDRLTAHNCKLMHMPIFRQSFEILNLDIKFCGHLGSVRFHTSSLEKESSLCGKVALVLDRLNDILDHCMFLFYKDDFPKSLLSASIVFIGCYPCHEK